MQPYPGLSMPVFMHAPKLTPSEVVRPFELDKLEDFFPVLNLSDSQNFKALTQVDDAAPS